MVPDYNVHMVTSKRHKTDKEPTCGACFSVKIWD